MDFALTDIQTQFRQTLRRFVAERAGQGMREDPREVVRRWSGTYWSELAELGAFAAFIPEAYDGLGGDAVDAMVILEALGRGLAAAPAIETAIIAAGLIERLGSESQKLCWLPAIAAGRLKLVFIGEGNAWPFPTGLISTFEATRTASGDFRLDGHQDIVPVAPECDTLLILARIGGSPALTLFMVERSNPALFVKPYWTVDDRAAGTVKATALQVSGGSLIGPIGGAAEAVEDVLNLAVVGQCAEAMGIMASLLMQTVAHLKTRTQFGQALAGNQALQHRLADMYMAYELALSATYKATIVSRKPRNRESQIAVSAAKVQVIDAARLIGHEAIQMHGAIGMTIELPIGRAVKRLKAMEPQFGSAEAHLRRYRALRRGDSL